MVFIQLIYENDNSRLSRLNNDSACHCMQKYDNNSFDGENGAQDSFVLNQLSHKILSMILQASWLTQNAATAQDRGKVLRSMTSQIGFFGLAVTIAPP